jgi:hypothetical protein
MMKSKKMLIGVFLLASLMVGVAVATIYQTRTVSNTVFVQGTWDFNVYTNPDRTTVWSSEAWGTMARGANANCANKYAVNLAADPIYIKWSASVSTGFTLTCKQGADGVFPGDFVAWAQNTYIGPFAKSAAGQYAIGMYFTLTATSDAPTGTTSITITFTGADTASG